MNAYTTGLAAVAIGAITVFAPLPTGWKVAGGILALALGTAAIIMATRRESAK